jgi:hypothetical protein
MSCLVFISGCFHTEYKPYDESRGTGLELSRTVNFYLNPDFTDNPPRCVLVLQPPSNDNHKYIGRVEKALARHLSERFPRVIASQARDLKAANLAFDLTLPVDRRDFARAVGCGAVLEFYLFETKHRYMLVWSEIRMGIEARLFRQQDGLELWKARHVAKRSDGGVSLSPFGLALNAYEANVFASDGDVVESVTEDLVRRIIASLPNQTTR